MPEYVLISLVLALIVIVGAVPLGTLSYLGYTGHWRSFLTMSPGSAPTGRYWGLLSTALMAAGVVWACGTSILHVVPRTRGWAGEHSFWFLTAPSWPCSRVPSSSPGGCPAAGGPSG